VCGEVGGFHNRLTHDNTLVSAEYRLPSGWLKQYLDEKKYWEEEEKARVAESVSALFGIPVEEPEELGGFGPTEVKTVTIKYDTFIALVAGALSYSSRLPYGSCPREVAVLLPEGWLEKYNEERTD
jgi:hypothetical protein